MEIFKGKQYLSHRAAPNIDDLTMSQTYKIHKSANLYHKFPFLTKAEAS